MDLKQIVKENPICLADEQKLRGHLTDLCPNEKAKVRIVVAIFSLGIAEEIKNSMSITEIDMERFCTRLENEGYSSKVSKECIDLWLEVYDKTIAKPEVVAPKNTMPITTTPPTPKTTLKPTSNTNIQSNTKPTPITPKASNQPRRFCFSKDGVTYVRNLNDFEIDSQGTLVKYKGNDPYVLMPDSVKEIGNGAFRGNKTLTYIIIPDSVTSIGDNAFNCCFKLCDITIQGNLKSIGKNAFCVCSISNFNIPDSVTSIGHGAFNSCWNLTDVILPKKLSCISDYTFFNCKNLTNILMPNNVTEIGFSAFGKCSNLESITIPEKVDNIHPKAFKRCKNLKAVYLQSEDQKQQFQKVLPRGTATIISNTSISKNTSVTMSSHTNNPSIKQKGHWLAAILSTFIYVLFFYLWGNNYPEYQYNSFNLIYTLLYLVAPLCVLVLSIIFCCKSNTHEAMRSLLLSAVVSIGVGLAFLLGSVIILQFLGYSDASEEVYEYFKNSCRIGLIIDTIINSFIALVSFVPKD